VVEGAPSVRTVVLPFALIACTVWPHLCALTVALGSEPRSIINSAIRVLVLSVFNQTLTAGGSTRASATFILALTLRHFLYDNHFVVGHRA
jgi:hypothetical protein